MQPRPFQRQTTLLRSSNKNEKIVLLHFLSFVSVGPPLENCFPITIQLQLDDRQITWTDSHRRTRSIDLLLCHSFHMHNPFFAVDRSDSAFAAFEAAAGDKYFVVFTDRDRFDLQRISPHTYIEMVIGPRETTDRKEGSKLPCIVFEGLLREGHS